MHFLFRRTLILAGFLGLTLAAGLLLALPNTQGSTPAPSPASDAQTFLAYVLYLEPDDFTTYTYPMHGFSFSYPKCSGAIT
jgi:hypothetical protein